MLHVSAVFFDAMPPPPPPNSLPCSPAMRRTRSA